MAHFEQKKLILCFFKYYYKEDAEAIQKPIRLNFYYR